MAKSMRSKRRRKMRNIKRQKYGEIELERLKLLVKNKKSEKLPKIKTVKSVEMKDVSEASTCLETKMDADVPKNTYDKKTGRNEHGQYPVWMNQRAIRKHRRGVGKSMRRKKC